VIVTEEKRILSDFASTIPESYHGPDRVGYILENSSKLADDEKVAKVALSAGQGIICNNVLHNRTGFEDSEQQKRLMYRARYYDDVTLSV
jgi:hypothetical protein